MKMIVTQSIAPAVQFRLVWLNQLHKKCLTGVKVQNSPYQQCGATQVMALFWFSSSFLHFLSYSSTNLHNTVFPTRCNCFRWLLPLYSSWVTEDHIPENKGIIVPLVGFDVGDENRLPHQKQKRKKTMFEITKWGRPTRSYPLEICETSVCSGSVTAGENEMLNS